VWSLVGSIVIALMTQLLAPCLSRARRFGFLACSVGLFFGACRTVAVNRGGLMPQEPLDWASLDSMGYAPLPVGRMTSIGPTFSAIVPPHTVVGAVYDDISGEALPNVEVIMLVPGPGHRYTTPRTRTDSLGRFHLTGIDGKYDTLWVSRIGLSPVYEGLDLSAARGVAVLIAMRHNTLVLCPGIIMDPHALVVHLRDLATGLPPTREVEVRATGPDTTDVVRVRPAPVSADSVAKETSMTVRVGLNGASRYDVLVRARGYHDWIMRGVRVTAAPCELNVRSLDVWLVPSS